MFLLFIQAGIVSNGFYFLIHIDLFNVHWLVSVLFSIPCTTSSVAIGFYGTKLFISVQSTQLNGLKWNMFIASANTDVNFTNSRRICENFSKTSNFNCEYCVSLWKKILIRRLLLCVHNCSYMHDLKELSDIKSIHRKNIDVCFSCHINGKIFDISPTMCYTCPLQRRSYFKRI